MFVAIIVPRFVSFDSFGKNQKFYLRKLILLELIRKKYLINFPFRVYLRELILLDSVLKINETYSFEFKLT